MIAGEDFLNAIQSELTSNLETEILAIESARSVTIDRWKVLSIFYDKSRQYPKIEIVPDAKSIEYGSGDSPIIEGISYFNAYIYVSVAGLDDTEAGLVLSRYAEAIENVFDSSPSHNDLGGVVDWALLDETEWAQFAVALEDRRLEYSLRISLQAKKHN